MPLGDPREGRVCSLGAARTKRPTRRTFLQPRVSRDSESGEHATWLGDLEPAGLLRAELVLGAGQGPAPRALRQL